jgi:hypothetical protein
MLEASLKQSPGMPGQLVRLRPARPFRSYSPHSSLGTLGCCPPLNGMFHLLSFQRGMSVL